MKFSVYNEDKGQYQQHKVEFGHLNCTGTNDAECEDQLSVLIRQHTTRAITNISGATVATLFTQFSGEWVAVHRACSFCCAYDRFDKETGRLLALKRVLAAAGFGRAGRSVAWEAYHLRGLTAPQDIYRTLASRAGQLSTELSGVVQLMKKAAADNQRHAERGQAAQ